jgi:hypothetical protein
MRQEVQDFLKLGSLPSNDADEDVIARHQIALFAIPKPVSDEEAQSLIKCFGSDDCCGLAWSLLHLVETSPGAPFFHLHPLPDNPNPWVKRLWERANEG